jgi:hypothetical protein
MDNDARDPVAGMFPWMQLWFDAASKAMEAGQTWTGPAWAGPTASPDVLRQARSAFMKTWSDCWEQWLRSSAFLDSSRQSLAGGMEMHKHAREFVDQVQRELRVAGRQDVDELALAIRRAERRVLDQLDEVSERLDAVAARLESLEARLDPPEDGPRHSEHARSNHRKRKPTRDDSAEPSHQDKTERLPE